MSLLVVLVVVSAALFALASIMTWTFQVSRINQRSADQVGLSVFANNVFVQIMDSAAWAETIAHNPLPPAPPGGAFVLYDATGAVFYDAQGARGQTLQGLPCNTFPSAECPIKYRLTWALTSIGAANPVVTITTAVQTSPFFTGSIAAHKLTFSSVNTPPNSITRPYALSWTNRGRLVDPPLNGWNFASFPTCESLSGFYAGGSCSPPHAPQTTCRCSTCPRGVELFICE
jgi:hypothetical protein